VRAFDVARQARAESQKMSWRPFRSDVGRFEVEMPGEVKFERTLNDGKETSDGTAVEATTSAGTFEVVYLPRANMSVQADAEFLLAATKSTLISKTSIMWDGNVGAAITARMSDGSTLLARIFLLQGTLLRFLVLDSREGDGDAEHFFSTVKFF
jgi:hypothetical protein